MALEDQYRKSAHIKSLTFAVFLGLLVYYGIIIFHWQVILDVITKTSLPLGGIGSILLLVGYVLFLLVAPAIAKTGMAFKVKSLRNSKQEAIESVKSVSFYLCLVIIAIAASIRCGVWLSQLFKSQYWQHSHWFWVCVIVLLLFGLTLNYVINNDLISWKMLQDVKAIPIVSPVFCFGAPAFWSSNLAYASLNRSLIATYSTLSILSGIIFLIYLVAFGILNHKFSAEEKIKENLVLAPSGKPIFETSGEVAIATKICLTIFGIGLYIFVVVLVDVLIHLSLV